LILILIFFGHFFSIRLFIRNLPGRVNVHCWVH
jgi:hypothetical protein